MEFLYPFVKTAFEIYRYIFTLYKSLSYWNSNRSIEYLCIPSVLNFILNVPFFI